MRKFLADNGMIFASSLRFAWSLSHLFFHKQKCCLSISVFIIFQDMHTLFNQLVDFAIQQDGRNNDVPDRDSDNKSRPMNL